MPYLKLFTSAARAAAAAAALAVAPALLPAQETNLEPASAAEIQHLLQLQEKQTAVLFDNHTPPRIPVNAFDRLFMWNEIALDTTAIDHTPVQPGQNRVFGEQYGPARASRAMAVIHIALFEAVNAETRKYQSYTGLKPASGQSSLDLAVAQAGHDALVYLYPSQAPRLDAILAADAARIAGSPASLQAGRTLGQAAAKSIIALRDSDGAQIPDPSVGGPFTLIGGVGHWSPDPISKLTVYLGAYWGQVKPFTLAAGDQFRAPAPPALTDPLYTAAFRQIKTLGGDPRFGTPTTRTADQTIQGIFWSYDGTPALCAPPRLYNQVARAVALQHGLRDVSDAARMLALVNTAMADAAIAAWDSKWHYQFWRPVTAVRSADQAGNTQVDPDPAWYPLGGQATNTRGPNFTPPFPAYVSGHATIGGALFQILRHYYSDATPFVFISDEWNGLNKDISGKTRPLRPLEFSSLTDAERQNAESRIWLGVHWQFDADQGVLMGNKVGDWVWDHAFQPVK